MIEVDELNLSVTNSPFTEGQATQINELLQTLTPEQKVWLSGYLVANQQLTSGTSDTQGSQIELFQRILKQCFNKMNQQFNLKTSDYIIIWFRNRKCARFSRNI